MAKNYRIDFTIQSKEELLSLPVAINRRILKKLYFFAAQENPFLFATKLVGQDNTYRFRIGDYRAIFDTLEDRSVVILQILKVGHRRNVYE